MSERPCFALPPSSVEEVEDLTPAHKKAVQGALRWAWQQLIATHCTVLHTGTEEEITAALESQLGQTARGVRIAPGIKDFEHPARGAKQRTADGGLEKQPDLTFRPPLWQYQHVANTSGWGLFVECKLIESGHGTRTVHSYIHAGVQRFAIGEYAPHMPSGMMLAYVRDKTIHTPAESLAPFLPFSNATEIKRGETSDICTTLHPREKLVPACVDILLSHFWLKVP